MPAFILPVWHPCPCLSFQLTGDTYRARHFAVHAPGLRHAALPPPVFRLDQLQLSLCLFCPWQQGGLYELDGPQDPAIYGDPAAARHPPPISTPPPPPGNMQHAQAAAARAVKDAEHPSAVAASASAAAAAAHSAGSSDRLDVTGHYLTPDLGGYYG